MVDLGIVNHSGSVVEEDVEIEKSKKNNVLRKTIKRKNSFDQEKIFMHIIVKNAVNDTEIGEAKIELDELIDTQLQDLAQEYCVCLNRTDILNEMKQKRI